MAVLGGLSGGAVGGAGDGEGAAPWAVETPPPVRGADTAADAGPKGPVTVAPWGG